MKPRTKWPNISTVSLIVFILLALVLGPYFYVQLVSLIGPVNSFLAIVFPAVLALISGLLANVQSESQWNEQISRLENAIKADTVPYYGTKYNVPKVPDKNAFWLGLLIDAELEFIVVGRSNKHWIKQGGDAQLAAIGENILRIISAGGRVAIVSNTSEAVIQDTKRFVTNFVVQPIQAMKQPQRRKMVQALKERFTYTVADRISYNAVVSDARVMVIPALNSYEFRSDSIVLEINKAFVSDAFKSYRNDIQRTIRDSGKRYFPGEWDNLLV